MRLKKDTTYSRFSANVGRACEYFLSKFYIVILHTLHPKKREMFLRLKIIK